MSGRRGLIMGVANDHSIAWSIAEAAHRQGATLAFTHQGPAFMRRVEPLAESVGATLIMPCDVSDKDSLDEVFNKIGAAWGGLDFVLHAIAYSDKNELRGRYFETSRENFLNTLDVSCYSFTAVAQRAAPLMSAGGCLVTLTYSGSERVMPNYNVMGVAKASLEASVRFLAADMGPKGIRVNAISAGPIKTLAAAGIAGFRKMLSHVAGVAPLRRNVTIEDVGNTAAFLCSDLAAGITGEVIYVDGGFNSVGMSFGGEERSG